MLKRCVALLLVATLAACSSDDTSGEERDLPSSAPGPAAGDTGALTPDPGPLTPDPGPLTPDPQGGSAAESDADSGAPAPDPCPATSAPCPKTPAERGWRQLKSIIHLHSAFSHDACDDEPLDEHGEPKKHCNDRLRDALCREQIDVALLTDHENHMKDFSFERLLLYEEAAGDELLLHAPGEPNGNLLGCPGEAAEVARPLLMVGCEGSKIMPVGFDHHLQDLSLYDVEIDDERAAEYLEAAVDAGAVPLVTHSEDDVVTVEGLVHEHIEGLDVYNFHANAMQILGTKIDRLMGFDAFLSQEDGTPEGDTALLGMLDLAPQVPYERWDRVLAQRRYLGWAATDTHENVVLEPWCEPGGKLAMLCPQLREQVPNLAAILEEGGWLLLNDGDRLDSYARTFRWITNRLLVPDEAPLTPDTVRDTLREHRLFISFDVLGEPRGFDFVARTASGAWVEMGAPEPDGDKLEEVFLRVPVVEPPLHPVFEPSEGAEAELFVRIYAIGDEGRETILETEVAGDEGKLIRLAMPEDAVVRAEVHVRPLHLRRALKSRADLADVTYPWVVANSFRSR